MLLGTSRTVREGLQRSVGQDVGRLGVAGRSPGMYVYITNPGVPRGVTGAGHGRPTDLKILLQLTLT